MSPIDWLANENCQDDNHPNHLCYLHRVEYYRTHKDEFLELVRDPTFICNSCGRTARDELNVCTPLEL